MVNVTIAFEVADYDSYSTTQSNVSLSTREAALLASVAPLLLYREAWGDEMSDEEWDALEVEISEIIGKIDDA